MSETPYTELPAATVPLVSFIVPLCNHALYVRQCLQSILQQDYPRKEIIIIDDGSVDESFAVAQSWVSESGSSIERCVLVRQSNAGITRTLNRLVSLSQGDYLFPIASDDMVIDGALSDLMKFCISNNYSNHLIFSNVKLFNSTGVITENAVAYYGREENLLAVSTLYLKYDVLLRWGIPYQHQFYSRAYYHEVGGYREELEFEDIHFGLVALARKRGRYFPGLTRMYRRRDNGSVTPGLTLSQLSRAPSRIMAMCEYGILDRCILHVMNMTEKEGAVFPNLLLRGAIRFLHIVIKISARFVLKIKKL